MSEHINRLPFSALSDGSHWYLLFLFGGIVFLPGAVLNWNWLCNPHGPLHSQLLGWSARRLTFGVGGTVLIIVGVLMWLV